MKEYRFIGNHAEELEGGRPIEPGEYTGLIKLEAHNLDLFNDGLLLEVPKGTAPEGQGALTGDALNERARELDIEGRTKMSADELREAVAEREANPHDEDGDGE